MLLVTAILSRFLFTKKYPQIWQVKAQVFRLWVVKLLIFSSYQRGARCNGPSLNTPFTVGVNFGQYFRLCCAHVDTSHKFPEEVCTDWPEVRQHMMTTCCWCGRTSTPFLVRRCEPRSETVHSSRRRRRRMSRWWTACRPSKTPPLLRDNLRSVYTTVKNAKKIPYTELKAKAKVLPVYKGPSPDLRFNSPQPDTSRSCNSTDTELVYTSLFARRQKKQVKKKQQTHNNNNNKNTKTLSKRAN